MKLKNLVPAVLCLALLVGCHQTEELPPTPEPTSVVTPTPTPTPEPTPTPLPTPTPPGRDTSKWGASCSAPLAPDPVGSGSAVGSA